jgi:hypothetical protein
MKMLRYLAVAIPLAAAGWLWSSRNAAALHVEPAAAPSALVAPGRVESVRDTV